MENIYRAATNFGSEPAEPKTKISLNRKFLGPIQTETRKSKQINFALEITQNQLTKSI